jgi:hypothetical protein
MSPSELESMLMENPTKPHRLTLASGDTVIVPNLRSVVIDNIVMKIFDFLGPNRAQVRGSRMVSIPNIVLVEMLDSLPPGRSARRGR